MVDAQSLLEWTRLLYSRLEEKGFSGYALNSKIGISAPGT